MTPLPSGLASISSQFDDSPKVRGAVAFGRMVAKRREGVNYGPGFCPVQRITRKEAVEIYGEPDTLTLAIDRHAALVIGSAYKGRDQR